MNAQTLDTVLTIVVPLVLTSPVWVQAFNWLTQSGAQGKQSQLRTVCVTAVKAVAHTLLQGQLLTDDHLAQAIGVLQTVAPGVNLLRAQPVLKEVMHDVNTAILQTVAQQTQAAAATPTVITPAVDYAQLAGALLQAALSAQPAPPVPTPLPVPVPVPPTP
jgi:hypothetical protein